MSWYQKSSILKQGNEYVGADATLSNDEHIHQSRVRNVENQILSPIYSNPQTKEPLAISFNMAIAKPESCPVCHQDLVPTEFMEFKNSRGEEVFKCKGCGYTNNDYKRKVEKGGIKKRRTRVHHRRRSSSDKEYKTAATPANPSVSTYNNISNTPYGRTDLTEEERVMPWEALDDGFYNEFDKVRQINNKETKVIKVKGKDGKPKYIRVKKKMTGGRGVQPSNIFTQKNRLKKQPRYNPADGKNKEGYGAWPHNRPLSGQGAGWYNTTYPEVLDSDMKMRYQPWNEYVNDRNSQGLYK